MKKGNVHNNAIRVGRTWAVILLLVLAAVSAAEASGESSVLIDEEQAQAMEKAKLKSIAANGDEQAANNLPKRCFVPGMDAFLAQ